MLIVYIIIVLTGFNGFIIINMTNTAGTTGNIVIELSVSYQWKDIIFQMIPLNNSKNCNIFTISQNLVVSKKE